MTDPTLDEEQESSGAAKGVDEFSLTIGYLPSLDQVAALLQEGTTSPGSLVAEVRVGNLGVGWKLNFNSFSAQCVCARTVQ